MARGRTFTIAWALSLLPSVVVMALWMWTRVRTVTVFRLMFPAGGTGTCRVAAHGGRLAFGRARHDAQARVVYESERERFRKKAEQSAGRVAPGVGPEVREARTRRAFGKLTDPFYAETYPMEYLSPPGLHWTRTMNTWFIGRKIPVGPRTLSFLGVSAGVWSPLWPEHEFPGGCDSVVAGRGRGVVTAGGRRHGANLAGAEAEAERMPRWVRV